jgi:hypothetical protein
MNLKVGVYSKDIKEGLPRYELKMVTSRAMHSLVTSWLKVHPLGFYVCYPPRRVNNLYFDTPALDRYTENLGGTSERRKVRLRWYGHDVTGVTGTFEVKCKRNKLGWKLSQRLPNPIDIADQNLPSLVATVREQLTDELRLQLDLSGLPVVINGYDREYYVSADNAIRVTLDFGLAVYDQRYATGANLRYATPVPDDMVVELKARADAGDGLREAVAGIPLRVTKRSKYALGIASTLG